ncbi:hypothetical protein V6Z11_D12G112900 [Gossypium hirsutum]|uniref:Protein VASCULAR ASSOCIATED DEATH 1, chloroplastic isoform X2 n=1 Tax=Gossypium hirsutum TaxID=3635 RepID=A0ABM3B6A8_GOSHI|nr:protein VASCULAR ASSOCIATED DEATH 1, chloroplastic-like isoform X2 [Gossypium hirsutum]
MANTSHRDVEIQSPTTLKSEEYRQLFRLPPEEFLVQDFNCAFQDSILFQGHMYLFAHFICFYSNIFGFETKIIAFNEIKSVKKAKTAGIFSNAIEIFAGGRKYFFTSFSSRDEAFKLINDGWVQYGNGGNEITEQQELMLESCSKENGFVAIEKVNSFKTLINDMESRDGGEDVSTTNNFKVPSTSEKDTEVGPESIINTNSSTPTDSCFLVPENCDAPKVPDYFIKVAETKFPIKVEEFFNLYFSDNAINFIKSFHTRRGDKEFKCSSWFLHDKFGHVRDMSYQHPIKVYLGAKFCSCKESQKFQIYRNSHWVLETSQEVNDVPYGDYFHVEGFWDVERDSDGPVEGCISRVYVNVAFNKKTVWKGKIVKSTLEECQEAYATWLDMARELLKQNIDKQGGVDPSGSSTENGGHQIENKVATIEEPLERSQNLSDPVRTLQMSTFMDVNQRIADLLQGTLSNASSIASFLSKFLRKSFSYSKRQGHISLLLAVAFAAIFLMQASIVVLLKKPQQVLVRYPVTYMGSAGGGAGERQAEAVAWLEKRMHELKEQMAMVESLLERMRDEHAALKAQLEQLGVEG